jgi:hypothetical protein
VTSAIGIELILIEGKQRSVEVPQRGWPLILSALRKRTSLHRKAKISIARLSRVAKKCCFIEIIGDTFAQC